MPVENNFQHDELSRENPVVQTWLMPSSGGPGRITALHVLNSQQVRLEPLVRFDTDVLVNVRLVSPIFIID